MQTEMIEVVAIKNRSYTYKKIGPTNFRHML